MRNNKSIQIVDSTYVSRAVKPIMEGLSSSSDRARKLFERGVDIVAKLSIAYASPRYFGRLMLKQNVIVW